MPIIDFDTGEVIEVNSLPNPLLDTIFVALNMQACSVQNHALYETFSDPGNQLEWLEEVLFNAAKESKTVIIAGSLNPGSPKCNRQWSQRYSSLIDAF